MSSLIATRGGSDVVRESRLYLDFEQGHHLFIPDISIAPLQVHYYSEALPTTI